MDVEEELLCGYVVISSARYITIVLARPGPGAGLGLWLAGTGWGWLAGFLNTALIRIQLNFQPHTAGCLTLCALTVDLFSSLVWRIREKILAQRLVTFHLASSLFSLFVNTF